MNPDNQPIEKSVYYSPQSRNKLPKGMEGLLGPGNSQVFNPESGTAKMSPIVLLRRWAV